MERFAPPQTDEMHTATEDSVLTHPGFAESAAHLTDMLRGLVSRWETLDFTAAAGSIGLGSSLQPWREADDAALPQAYERR